MDKNNLNIKKVYPQFLPVPLDCRFNLRNFYENDYNKQDTDEGSQ